MVLKLILIGVILYFLYRVFGGKFNLPKKESRDEDGDGNTLVECCKCSVFVSKKEATKKDGKFYCDECV